ncbi:hypothetical protein NESM_000710500 [Novymonas esmeraldas]|uniref:Uncharacterized protein n=1 Tax=Novymonas esmeraldas TaxID=1808958 RepID=A0AAW0EVZ4_9TRYP
MHTLNNAPQTRTSSGVSPRDDELRFPIRKLTAAPSMAVPELTAAALGLLKSGAFQRALGDAVQVPGTPESSPPPSKRSRTSASTSAASWLCSVDALITDECDAGLDTPVQDGADGGVVAVGVTRRLSLSLITDTDIVDECRSLVTADGSVSHALPHVVENSNTGAQRKARACPVARACKAGVSSQSPTSMCTEIVHTEATTNSDVLTKASKATNTSLQSVVGAGNFLRSARGRAWTTAVPQSNRPTGIYVVSPLDEAEEVEEAISSSSPVVHRGHRLLSWGVAETSASVVEEDIQCDEAAS